MVHIPNLHAQLVELAALVGLALPFLAAVLKQDKFSAKVNNLIAIGSAVLAGVLTALVQNQLSLSSITQSVVAVVVLSHTAYEALYKPQGWAETIQRLTSFHHGSTTYPVAGEPQPLNGAPTPAETSADHGAF